MTLSQSQQLLLRSWLLIGQFCYSFGSLSQLQVLAGQEQGMILEKVKNELTWHLLSPPHFYFACAQCPHALSCQ